MARKKATKPQDDRLYPENLRTLWSHHDSRAWPSHIAERFASTYFDRPRQVCNLDGRTAEPGWRELGLFHVGAFQLDDSRITYWLLGRTDGAWTVSRPID